MFGSSKNTNGFGPIASPRSNLTGLERAKLERAREPSVPLPLDELPDAGVYPADLQPAKPVIQKRGPTVADRARQAEDSSAHLYIGANIKLKGEIAGCDLMRVEGTFEGLSQARQLVVCPGGSFIGTAVIDEAEVEGAFEGTLHVRGRLFLRNKGRIRGTFSYGQLEIERGGEIDGKINPFEKPAERPSAEPARPVAKPAAAIQPVAPQPVRPAQATAPARPGLNGSQPIAGTQAPAA